MERWKDNLDTSTALLLKSEVQVAGIHMDVESRATRLVDSLHLEGKTHMVSRMTINILRLNDLSAFAV